MVIGHDFSKTTAGEQQAKLLTNSVFRNPVTSLHVLSFEHYVDPSTVQNGRALLTSYATAHGVTLTLTISNDDDVVPNGAVTIASEDVMIIWDQPNAPAGTLGAIGSSWAPKLTAFAQSGGIVVALDAARGVAEMGALVTNAGLLAVTGHAPVAAQTPADVPAAGLSIAVGMTNVYLVDANTAAFTTSEPASSSLIFVANVQGQPAQLLAVHRIVH
jgi:hypothetical protein